MCYHRGRALRWLGLRSLDDRGATAVEYGLMVSLIALMIIGAVTVFGGALKTTLFDMINTSLSSL